ncbi:hypothetical protein QYF61_027035 [Mycteria americana]|uniref:Uncharacterized protein n=1 Tax=Mycteria americana TaxID=33587 RepID=A0AAN7S7C1_MYCAM|nr:hypothetical protein QYF61_027035 [Mycteria americana]
MLQHLNVLLVVRGPKLNTVFEVRPHQCRVQGDDHFPSPAGYTIPDTSQDAIGFLGHLGTLPAHVQAAVNQHPQVLFHWAAFQPLFPKPVALHGVAVAQVQDLALGLVKPHTVDLGPSIQPVQSLPTLKQINTPAQLGVICKLTEGALDPLIQIIDKDIKQNRPQHRALGNTACDQPPTGFNSVHHNSLDSAMQPRNSQSALGKALNIVCVLLKGLCRPISGLDETPRDVVVTRFARDRHTVSEEGGIHSVMRDVHHWEELSFAFFTDSMRYLYTFIRPPRPSLLPAEHHQLSQPLLI